MSASWVMLFLSFLVGLAFLVHFVFFLSVSESFGERITCKLSEYLGDTVPSPHLIVRVQYGKHTTTTIRTSFQFSNNPSVSDHQPRSSFIWSVLFARKYAIQYFPCPHNRYIITLICTPMSTAFCKTLFMYMYYFVHLNK